MILNAVTDLDGNRDSLYGRLGYSKDGYLDGRWFYTMVHLSYLAIGWLDIHNY